jgi:hypothetical protein
MNIFKVIGYWKEEDESLYRMVAHLVIGTSSADAQKRLIENEHLGDGNCRYFIQTDEWISEHPCETILYFTTFSTEDITETKFKKWYRDNVEELPEHRYGPAPFREFKA